MVPTDKIYSLLREGWEEVALNGAIVAADGSGKVYGSVFGDPAFPARSVLKPFQFLAADLPADRWQGALEHSRYAACVGSVSATADQISSLTAWYRKGKAKALSDYVQVPPTFPYDAVNRASAQLKGAKTLYHMCFSKHVGILEGCDHHGWDKESYLSMDHPFHRNLVSILERELGRSFADVKWVVDGCGLPTPILPLSQIAQLYWRIVSASEGSPLHWVKRLMWTNPFWIGGPGRSDTCLMEANPGKLIAKEGADGLLAVAVSEAEGFPNGLGIVLKLSAGTNLSAAKLAMVPMLEKLGLKTVHTDPPRQEVVYHYRPFEGRRVFDLSPSISPELSVWPGDVGFERKASLETAKGSHLTLSSVNSTLHIGAHTDAPIHFAKDADTIDKVDVHKYFGPCEVIEVKGRPSEILPEHLSGRTIRAPRVLFKTGSFPNPAEFNEDFSALSESLVRWLAARGVCLVGIDTPSVDPFSSKDLLAHKATLEFGMGILEGVVLDKVPEGTYQLHAIPLRIADGDSSPVRALLIS